MITGMKKEIIRVSYKEWQRFQPYLSEGPCVSMAFPQGDCFAILAGDGIETMAAMVWYTYVFRNSPYRLRAMMGLKFLDRSEQITFLNENVRLLARVSTLPEYRRLGYAKRLVAGSVGLLGVEYIECLTAWEDVRRLLRSCGFTCYRFENATCGKKRDKIDYWLWRRIGA